MMIVKLYNYPYVSLMQSFATRIRKSVREALRWIAVPSNRPEHLRSQAGFTLIEIMVVIAIIGILATLIVPKIMGRPDEARVTAAKHDLATMSQALKLYRLDIGRYPTTEQGLKALVERPTSEPVPQNWKAGGYLDRLPNDPWGKPYQYTNPGTKGEIDLYSFGADGKPGGAALDADVYH
jgi:general secretion pathway protein G